MSFRDPLQRQASLKPEITFLIDSNVPSRPDRLRVSSGIQLASKETTGQKYQADAYIPRLPFLPCDGAGLLQADGNSTRLRAQTIGLLKINDRLLEKLRTTAARFRDPADLHCY